MKIDGDNVVDIDDECRNRLATFSVEFGNLARGWGTCCKQRQGYAGIGEVGHNVSGET